MQIEFFVEEPSMEEALKNLVPAILGPYDWFWVHAFQGKLDLMRQLGPRLKGYSRRLQSTGRIIVLVDRDADDCHELKTILNTIAGEAGFIPRSDADSEGGFHILIRIVIEELEAWFFGDPQALVTAYPRLPAALGDRAAYCDPDAIKGGTWEALLRVLQEHGYYPEGLPKIEVARQVSREMVPGRNRSRSFQVFWRALLEMTEDRPG